MLVSKQTGHRLQPIAVRAPAPAPAPAAVAAAAAAAAAAVAAAVTTEVAASAATAITEKLYILSDGRGGNFLITCNIQPTKTLRAIIGMLRSGCHSFFCRQDCSNLEITRIRS